MLVDLGRNDLGRVCEYGTVEVSSLMRLETYSTLIHIVSDVTGRLREGISPTDALRSVLPAGTLSGAPKVRAMQIIDELETVKRGAYGGAVGYLSYAGELDTCICIRTVVVKDGLAHVQAGGGTVADARPEYEFEESKTRPAASCAPSSSPPARGSGRDPGRRRRQLRLLHLQPRQYLGELGAEVEAVRNDAASVDELLDRAPDRVVVSPGPCTPNEAGISSRRCGASPEAGIPHARRLPRATSRWPRPTAGRVIRHLPVHGKTTGIEHDGTGIFAGLASPLTVGRYHSLVVEEESLPGELVATAWGGGVLMAMRHRELPVDGVQFHPESVLTPEGKSMLEAFLRA
jgi:anthranilate synthase/aminodeoxychorismate synthase-like glutamine amidotransferase